jgi:hypothetical protein
MIMGLKEFYFLEIDIWVICKDKIFQFNFYEMAINQRL